jgi:hypothetical protein
MNQHPSIIDINPQTSATHRYPIGFSDIDSATGGALVSGRLALLTGTANSGRTAQLLTAAAATAARTGSMVLIATCDETPDQVLGRLQARGIHPVLIESTIRIAHVNTLAQLAWFVSRVAQSDDIAALFVDDLPLLVDTDSTRNQAGAEASRLLAQLAAGQLAKAYEVTSGLPFGTAFDRGIGHIAPVAVMATVRQAKDGTVWGPLSLQADASLIATTDGTVLKSRDPVARRATPEHLLA